MEITWRKFYKSEALENSFSLLQSCRLGASCLACEFYKFPSTTGLDLSNMEDTYHRPDQKTLQALKDMANRLRIDSIESTNTAGSGYVQYAVILMLNFAARFNSQVALNFLILSFRHPSSCCSMAEVMSVLFFHTMRYKGRL